MRRSTPQNFWANKKGLRAMIADHSTPKLDSASSSSVASIVNRRPSRFSHLPVHRTPETNASSRRHTAQHPSTDARVPFSTPSSAQQAKTRSRHTSASGQKSHRIQIQWRALPDRGQAPHARPQNNTDKLTPALRYRSSADERSCRHYGTASGRLSRSTHSADSQRQGCRHCASSKAFDVRCFA